MPWGTKEQIAKKSTPTIKWGKPYPPGSGVSKQKVKMGNLFPVGPKVKMGNLFLVGPKVKMSQTSKKHVGPFLI